MLTDTELESQLKKIKEQNDVFVLPLYVFNGIGVKADYNKQEFIDERLQKNRLTKNLHDLNEFIIFVPVLINNNHFVLYVFMYEDSLPESIVLDSLYNDIDESYEKISKILSPLNNSGMSFWPLYRRTKLNKQESGTNDCGVFVILWTFRMIEVWNAAPNNKRIDAIDAYVSANDPTITRQAIQEIRDQIKQDIKYTRTLSHFVYLGRNFILAQLKQCIPFGILHNSLAMLLSFHYVALRSRLL
jgi:hypothetical protein